MLQTQLKEVNRMNKIERIVCLSLAFVIMNIAFLFSYNKQPIKEITIEQFNALEKKEESILLYIKRSDCPDCKKVDKKLEKRPRSFEYRWSKKKQQLIYSIDLKNEKNKLVKQKFIHDFNVKVVPTIIEVNVQSEQKITLDHFFELIF